MARILVTGDRGYAGGCIVAVLRRAGHDVSGLAVRLENITPASLDFDFVVHAAAARPHKPPEQFDPVNHLGTKRLIAGLARRSGIIFLSTRGVYSPTSKAFLDESDPAEPADTYGQSKRLAERALMASGHPWVALRLPAIFGWGAGQPGHSFLSNATRALLAGESVTVHEPDRQHDYLHVWTLAAMIPRLLAAGQAWDQVYNLAGPLVSHHEMMECLAAVVSRRVGRRARLEYRPGPPSRAAWLNYDKFVRTFGPTGQPDWHGVIEELVEKFPI